MSMWSCFARRFAFPRRLVARHHSAGLAGFCEKERSLPAAADIAPGSSDGRRVLEFWFNVEQHAMRQINEACMAYYDQKHPKHYLWRGHNQFLFDNVRPGDRVLDVGCGNSFYCQWIAEKAVEVIGVDIRQDRVATATRNNRMSNVRYMVADATRELPPGEFDVVICSHVIEHLDDPLPLLRNLAARIPRLLVKVPLVDSNWQKLVRKDIGLPWMNDADHRREYTAALLRKHLDAGGWLVDELIRGNDLRARCVSSLWASSKKQDVK